MNRGYIHLDTLIVPQTLRQMEEGISVIKAR